MIMTASAQHNCIIDVLIKDECCPLEVPLCNHMYKKQKQLFILIFRSFFEVFVGMVGGSYDEYI